VPATAFPPMPHEPHLPPRNLKSARSPPQ